MNNNLKTKGRPAATDLVQVRPPPAWRPLLLGPGTWEWLLALYESLRWRVPSLSLYLYVYTHYFCYFCL